MWDCALQSLCGNLRELVRLITDIADSGVQNLTDLLLVQLSFHVIVEELAEEAKRLNCGQSVLELL